MGNRIFFQGKKTSKNTAKDQIPMLTERGKKSKRNRLRSQATKGTEQ